MGAYKYKAFISYSHKDERWARWLHRRLENYPIPPHLIGKLTGSGEIPKRLKPIFRDREELAAADSLGEKIEQALADSENLIIICSPYAAQSHWVNQEVISFKRQNRGAKIFSLIVDGEPFASNLPGRESEECFPLALRFNVNADGNITQDPAEPLAADIRAHADGKRLGVLKLVAGMIGVGLDEIIQRDMRRGRKRVMAITATSLATVLAMGTLTGFAITTRKDAEARRNDAEGLIEFMLTDLKDKLEPVGRLDALQVVGDKAAAYYDQLPLSGHDDDALGRRARVFHFLGEIQYKQGNWKEATLYFEQAHEATQGLHVRDPKKPDRIFEHAQSAYWVGYLFYDKGQYERATSFFESYLDLAKRLGTVENSLRSKQEIAYAYTNLGSNHFFLGDLAQSQIYFKGALESKKDLFIKNPNNRTKFSLANGYAWLSDSYLFEPSLRQSVRYREMADDLYSELIDQNPRDLRVLRRSLNTQKSLSRLALLRGELDVARRHAELGLSRIYKIEAIEPNNFYAKRESIGFQFLQVEMDMRTLGDANMDVLLKTIEQKLLDIEPHIDGYLSEKVRLFALQTHHNIATGNLREGQASLSRAKAYLHQFNKTDVINNQEMIEVFLLDVILNGNDQGMVAFMSKCKSSKTNIYPNYVAQILTVYGSNYCPQFHAYEYKTSHIFNMSSSDFKTKPISSVAE